LLEAAEIGDIVVTSGGVSVGAHDLVKDVLGEIGAIDFWQVAMQPGRPLAIGRIGSAHFFGLPGNPVASMLAFMLFVRPAIYKLAGRRRLFPEMAEATAVETISKKKGRREFKRGVVHWKNGRWEARTTGPQGSGILSSMAAGNCLIVLEEERGDVAVGETGHKGHSHDQQGLRRPHRHRHADGETRVPEAAHRLPHRYADIRSGSPRPRAPGRRMARPSSPATTTA
jgi:molybdopterin molybdotransferase